MKKHNKTNLLPALSGAAFVVLHLFAGTASADYRGYWVDTVQQYQLEHSYASQPEPAYQGYGYQEPAYQPPYGATLQPDTTPMQATRPVGVGVASYYAEQYQGHPTASGEIYDMYAMTAAHPTLPFGTPIQVTNLQNGRSVVVRVNDRGPSKPGRIVDVSKAAAEQLGLILNGTAEVQVDVLG